MYHIWDDDIIKKHNLLFAKRHLFHLEIEKNYCLLFARAEREFFVLCIIKKNIAVGKKLLVICKYSSSISYGYFNVTQ